MNEEIHLNKCIVTIAGLEPGILLHNPAGMRRSTENKTAAKQIPSPENEAAAAAYWTEDGTSLAFPNQNIKSGLIQACAGWKSPLNKKLMLGPLVAGSVSIRPFMIPFGTKKYVVDVRRVVIQRQGILRARALLPTWKLKFELRWESQMLGADFNEGVLPELLTRLGFQIGLGDFRPSRKGDYGRFSVVSIESR